MPAPDKSAPLRGPDSSAQSASPGGEVVTPKRYRARRGADERRTRKLHLRLSVDELEAVRRAAALTGLTAGGYAAAAAVATAQGTRPPRVAAQRLGIVSTALVTIAGLREDLQRLGVNVNQLARYANTERHRPDGVQAAAAAVLEMLGKLDEATERLGDQR